MITFLAFALTIAGCVNWLLIGLLQYDFVAGIFGYQGSIFSRLVYIVIGAGALFLVVKLFIDKGSIHVWGSKKIKKEMLQTAQIAQNIEASKEDMRRKETGYNEQSNINDDYDYNNYNNYNKGNNHQQSFFDEHLGRK